jgi:hypothetical protein
LRCWQLVSWDVTGKVRGKTLVLLAGGAGLAFDPKSSEEDASHDEKLIKAVQAFVLSRA